MLRRSLLAIGVLVMMAAPATAGGGGCRSPQTDSMGTTVEMSYFCFSPTVVRVAEGETITWENLDPVDHNVYSSGFGTETLRGGMSASVTFAEAGVFPYVCAFHPGMMGAVVVGNADTPPLAALDAKAPAVDHADSKLGSPNIEKRLEAIEASLAAATAPNAQVEQLLAATEATLLTTPSRSSLWPPLALGTVGGLVIGVLAGRTRLSR